MPRKVILFPSQPVTLEVSEIDRLNQQLSDLRHAINNHLSLMLAAVEVIRRKPEASERMIATFEQQPPNITAALLQFSAEFEKVFGIEKA